MNDDGTALIIKTTAVVFSLISRLPEIFRAS